jgi:hypothetical protein
MGGWAQSEKGSDVKFKKINDLQARSDSRRLSVLSARVKYCDR